MIYVVRWYVLTLRMLSVGQIQCIQVTLSAVVWRTVITAMMMKSKIVMVHLYAP